MQKMKKMRPRTAKQVKKETCLKCKDHGICLAEARQPDYYCMKDAADGKDQ